MASLSTDSPEAAQAAREQGVPVLLSLTAILRGTSWRVHARLTVLWMKDMMEALRTLTRKDPSPAPPELFPIICRVLDTMQERRSAGEENFQRLSLDEIVEARAKLLAPLPTLTTDENPQELSGTLRYFLWTSFSDSRDHQELCT